MPHMRQGDKHFGFLLVVNALEALAKRRVFLFAKRDPDAAIYRSYDPASYWFLVGINLFIATGLFVVAFI